MDRAPKTIFLEVVPQKPANFTVAQVKSLNDSPQFLSFDPCHFSSHPGGSAFDSTRVTPLRFCSYGSNSGESGSNCCRGMQTLTLLQGVLLLQLLLILLWQPIQNTPRLTSLHTHRCRQPAPFVTVWPTLYCELQAALKTI